MTDQTTTKAELTRRRFVVQGALAVAGASLAACDAAVTEPAKHPEAPGTEPGADGDALQVYQLATVNPACGDKDRPKGCACRACVAHAANKLFPSREAAEGGRAHKHCKCTIREAGTLPRAKWTELFGDPAAPTGASADRRKQDIPAPNSTEAPPAPGT